MRVCVRVRPAYHPQANTGMQPAEARRQEGWGYLLPPTTPPRLEVSAAGKVGQGEYRPVGLTQSHKTRKQGFTIPEPEEGVGGGGWVVAVLLLVRDSPALFYFIGRTVW